MSYYSATTRGFYTVEDHGSNIPADAVGITAEEHAALLAGQGTGKVITADAEGRPILADPPAPTEAALAAQRRAAITVELTAIDAASARPLRAILYAQAHGLTPDPADAAKVDELEAQAVALRAELAGLGG